MLTGASASGYPTAIPSIKTISSERPRLDFIGVWQIETAFAQRLQRLGVDVIDRPSPETLRFQIGINQFRIGLDGNTWRTDISYKASLVEDGKTVASETVTGSAKRPKIAGRGGAEKAISEIFTDVINQLDIQMLFSKSMQ